MKQPQSISIQSNGIKPYKIVFKSCFQGSVSFSPFAQPPSYTGPPGTLPVRLDMIARNTIIVDSSPPTADPRIENTTNSRSPQTQKCNIQEINENIGQTHRIYQIQNCGTVYMDSCNACGVKMENCGNNVPQVTCSLLSLFFAQSLLLSSNLTISHYPDHRPRIIGNEKVPHSQLHAISSNGM